MKHHDYYAQRNIADLDKIYELLEELPLFCREYFVGIETRTSSQTRLKYAYDLRIYFHFLCKWKYPKKDVLDLTLTDLEEVTHIDIEQFLSYLSHYRFRGKSLSCNENAKARKLSTVRAMYKYFFNRDRIKVDNTAKVATPKLHEKEIIRLEGDEVPNLINAAESGEHLSEHAASYHSKTKIRDIAILTLFLGTGIRISELVGLDNDSFNFNDRSFMVTRKGGNRAILYFSTEVQAALEDYINEKNNDDRIPKNENAFFLSLQYKRINVRTVEILVKKYSKIVAPYKKITPHKLRSTFGTQLYKDTKDIYVVADVLGHRDVNTTKKHYAAITLEHRKLAAETVNLRQEPQKKKDP